MCYAGEKCAQTCDKLLQKFYVLIDITKKC